MTTPTKIVIKERSILSTSETETRQIGYFLGQHICSPLVITVTGELGAGKTCLTQGIARGLGVPETYYITSPSYSLVNEYPGRWVLYHIDLYRLEGSSEFEEIGLEEILTSDSVSVIEWAERLGDTVPVERLDIVIDIVNEEKRGFHLTSYGKQAEEILKAYLPFKI